MKCSANAVEYVIVSHIPTDHHFVHLLSVPPSQYSFFHYKKKINYTVDGERMDAASLCCFVFSVINVVRQEVSSIDSVRIMQSA
jgi:hypothetical protein